MIIKSLSRVATDVACQGQRLLMTVLFGSAIAARSTGKIVDVSPKEARLW